jgi:serine/threonine-protein kinase RsbW
MPDRILTITSRLEELSHVRHEVETFIGNTADEITTVRIVLSIDEAVANIITHGYRGSPDGIIEIHMKSSGNDFSFIITDNAPPFNPLAVDEPDIARYHSEGSSGGLGIDVYRRLMNARYERTENGGNRLILTRESHHE